MVSRLVSGPPELVRQLRQQECVQRTLPERVATVNDHPSTLYAGLTKDWDSNLIIDSDPDTDSYSDPSSDSYSDLDPDLDAPPETETEPAMSECPGSGAESDPEADEIMRNIVRFREEGPAKPRQTKRTKKLWMTESEFWAIYSAKIRKRTGLGAKDLIRRCDPSILKAYLCWRAKESTSKIKKQSTIDAYWNRVSMYYRDVTGKAMENSILWDVRNYIPSLGLDTTPKEKHAMKVQILYAIIHALWVDDSKPLPGFVRIQLSLLFLLSAATATRPGALVESTSDKGSNKVLCFKDVELVKVRCIKDPSKSTIIANLNLEHVKNRERGGTPKKFSFRLEGLAALCIVLHILSIGKGRKAFRNEFTSVQQIFGLVIPAERNMLRIRWKQELLCEPFFCDFDRTADGGRMRKDKAFSYAKYRDNLIHIALLLGMEEDVTFYDIRRNSGINIRSAITPAECNQVMGHTGDTYERYYTPTHIAHDFQAIIFGTPPEDELIRSVASMGLSRDRRAPVELNETQKAEIRNDPLLVKLRGEREAYKKELQGQGFHPLSRANGTMLYDKYQKTTQKIASIYQQKYRIRLKKAIRDFHDSIDTIEIAKQLSGKAAAEVLTLPTVEFELPERARIAPLLFKPIKEDGIRIEFVEALAQLFPLREMRRSKATKRVRMDAVVDSHGELASAKARKTRTGTRKFTTSKLYNQDANRSGYEVVVEIEPRHLYPNVRLHPVCGFCYGDKGLSHEARTKHWARKDVRGRHVSTHFGNGAYHGEFECPYPECSTILDDKMHFYRHSLEVHKVAH